MRFNLANVDPFDPRTRNELAPVASSRLSLATVLQTSHAGDCIVNIYAAEDVRRTESSSGFSEVSTITVSKVYVKCGT